MRRTPGFALVVLATLAVGIGANTAVFSVVSRVLIDRLPYRAPERLVVLYGATRENPEARALLSAAEIDAMQRRSRSLHTVAPFGLHGGYIYVSDAGADMWQGTRVGSTFFRALGVPALLGRTIDDRDVGPDAEPVAVLSYGLWQRAFGGDSGVVGRVVRLNDVSRTVIGVMPPTFVAPVRTPEVWVPLDLSALLRGRMAESAILGAVGRLADGATLARARAELEVVARQRPPAAAPQVPRLVNPVPVREAMVGEVRPVLLIVMGAAALVLVVACVNVAGLFLARATARRRELAVRAALGAGRWRLVRQMLTESSLVGLVGGAIGVVLAFWGKAVLVRLGERVLPAMGGAPRIDGGVLAFAVLASLASGLAFGLVPALAGSRTDLNAALLESSRGAAGGRVRARAGRALVAGQMALAIVLLIAAGLLGRTLVVLERTGVGYDTDRSVLTFRVNLASTDRYPDGASSARFFGEFLERVRKLPGVQSAGLIAVSPWNGWGYDWPIRVDGRADSSIVIRATASDGYFASLGIPVRGGRDMAATDREGSAPVAVVSETMARELWPGASPIGARIRFLGGADSAWREVIGVVADVRESALGEPQAVAYVPAWQSPEGGYELVVRTTGDASHLVGAIRRELHALDPALPLVTPRTMDEVFGASLAGQRLPMVFTTAFAALALLLAGLGVYGVMAYSVAAREREFGIRAALGASRGRVMALVLRQGMVTALAGAAVGLLAAWGAMRVLAGLLVGVTPHDAATFIAAPLILLVVSGLACLVPARRATRVEPLEALRVE
jgi:predicted permease